MENQYFVERVSSGFNHPREWTKAEVEKKAWALFRKDFPAWQSAEFKVVIERVDEKGLGFSDFVFVVSRVA